MASIIFDEQVTVSWGSSQSILDWILDTVLEQVDMDSEYYTYLDKNVKLYGGLDFYRLNKQQRLQFIDTVRSLLQSRQEEISTLNPLGEDYKVQETVIQMLQNLLSISSEYVPK
jgi:hypothetical protein